MDVEIRHEPMSALKEHGEIPTAFFVDKILEVGVSQKGLGGIILRERVVEIPYVKDYDAIKGEGPTRWLTRFDVSNWGLIAAYHHGVRIGGAVVAFNTEDLAMLGGEPGVAALWDIRIAPDLRHCGVGSLLFRAVREWARERGCTRIRIETQNINVAACHVYVRMNCVLESINRFAYRELPDEVQLLWRANLTSAPHEPVLARALRHANANVGVDANGD